MEKSALQITRAEYQPKLPVALRGALNAVEGEPTQSVDNVSGVINSFPAGVITTCTSAPFFTNPRMI